ncbi:hypothetical protein SZ55_4603 [Pseudomonas sp. FeS53a]|jgi:hypothetical protein|uniref:hypothetical protein n=1 Tax=Pseudomonas sp. FeS53a TaxID=1604022 RepID=UPI0005E17282|nr:hypothetical protein [Pseudomonas sp. FeS53a]KIV62710.1 hypothetical protein SZ55_4603 [Pseudomonas sp. FeS53a]
MNDLAVIRSLLRWNRSVELPENHRIEIDCRQQEARGIHATPKGDDFDDIHRP